MFKVYDKAYGKFGEEINENYSIPRIDSFSSRRFSKKKGDAAVLRLASAILGYYDRRRLEDFCIQDFQIDVDWDKDIINGMKMSKAEICCLLARMFIYNNEGERTRSQIRDMFWKLSSMSEDIRYVLENKVPYSYYAGYTLNNVRLNCQLIGEETLALEISDGIWGEMSFKEMNAYLSYHLHGRNVGKWKMLSPSKLYSLLLGKDCRESDLKVMMAFLEQNRSEKLVSLRALELVKSKLNNKNFILLNELSDLDKNTMLLFLVIGKDRDYLLRSGSLIEHRLNSSKQSVSTNAIHPYYKEDGSIGFQTRRYCVENLDSSSSIGDQVVTRYLTFANDNVSLNRINTMSNLEKSKFRLNKKGIQFLQKGVNKFANDLTALEEHLDESHFDFLEEEE